MLHSLLNFFTAFFLFRLLIEKKYINDVSFFSQFIINITDKLITLLLKNKIKNIITAIFFLIAGALLIKTALFFFMTKKQLNNNINYLTVMLDTTDTSMALNEFPPGFIKAAQLSIITVAADILKIYIFAFFLLNRRINTYSSDLNNAVAAFIEPVKKIMYKIKIFDFIGDENLAGAFFCMIVFSVTAFIIRMDFTFHQYINLLLACFYNSINIMNFIIIIIICAYFMDFSNYNVNAAIKKNFSLIADIFNKPLRKVFSFRIGRIDLIPVISVVLLYLMNGVFLNILLNIFRSYNINVIN